MKIPYFSKLSTKRIAASLLFIFICNIGIGQNETELGIAIGAMQYSGEVGQVSGNFLNPTSTPRPAFTAHYGRYLNNAIMLRGSLTYGQAGAADNRIPAGVNAFKTERNFEFRSRVIEAAVSVELYPLNLFGDPESNTRIKPYFLGGIGYFNFNPEGKYITPVSRTVDWVDLQPLRTAGQGLPVPAGAPTPPPLYSLNSSNFHFGFGLRYRLSQWFDLGLEFMNRRTNTDYFDDIGGGHFVDFKVFENAFGATTYKAETAKYLSNYPLYNFLNSGGPVPSGSFNINASRSAGVGRNDYYYTTSIKLIYFLKDNREKHLKNGVVPCPPQLKF